MPTWLRHRSCSSARRGGFTKFAEVAGTDLPIESWSVCRCTPSDNFCNALDMSHMSYLCTLGELSSVAQLYMDDPRLPALHGAALQSLFCVFMILGGALYRWRSCTLVGIITGWLLSGWGIGQFISIWKPFFGCLPVSGSYVVRVLDWLWNAIVFYCIWGTLGAVIVAAAVEFVQDPSLQIRTNIEYLNLRP